MPEFVYLSRILASAEEVFAWHSRPGAFERLQPPWESVRVEERTGSIKDGDRIVVQTRLGPFWIRWVAEHREYIEGRQFRDIQLRGPFAKWAHTHCFEPDGSDACILEDRIEYLLPFGPLGNLLGKRFTLKKLNRMFAYRHQTTIQDLAAHRFYKGGRTMKILVTGSTGLIGSALVPFLTTAGHQVVRMVRSKPTDGDQIQWDPYSGSLDKSKLEGFDAIVHLSGENIAGRWTAAKKAKLRDSRIKSTRLLSKTLAELQKPPKVWVCASAMGYYGHRGNEIMKENSPPGKSFLAETVQEWEAQVQPAIKKGIRVVNLRTGIVLSPAGGALKEMLLPFKMGVGGVIGSGEQYWSWIAIDDVVGAIYHCITTESLQGAVNVVSPNPATNREFSKTLGRVLSRPAIFPLPAFVARMVFGEMAEELLLSSIRVEPAKLQATGYPFRYFDLEGALRHVLGRA